MGPVIYSTAFSRALHVYEPSFSMDKYGIQNMIMVRTSCTNILGAQIKSHTENGNNGPIDHVQLYYICKQKVWHNFVVSFWNKITDKITFGKLSLRISEKNHPPPNLIFCLYGIFSTSQYIL